MSIYTMIPIHPMRIVGLGIVDHWYILGKATDDDDGSHMFSVVFVHGHIDTWMIYRMMES